MWTYKKAFDRLTEAYIKGEVNPYDCKACFVGNLLNKNECWVLASIPEIDYHVPNMLQFMNTCEGFYLPQEIRQVERFFMKPIDKGTPYYPGGGKGKRDMWESPTEEMEELLFKSFEASLEYLKQLHIAKGEIIEETPKFVKRNAQQNRKETIPQVLS